MTAVQANMPRATIKEEIMPHVIHYFVLIFIVFVCAEIRNVLFYETPYKGEPVSIWSETATTIKPAALPTK
ncbi:MAG: hypothetical protein ACI8ZB_000251 [Desulforhopalus sp.]|jgi:hypothetical protein